MNLKSSSDREVNECRLCASFKRSSAQLRSDRPWMTSERHAAIVSVGAFVPGWTLVCPLEHATNMQNSYHDSEFWTFASKVSTFISQQYGNVVAFEHGPNANDSLTGCGTGHAHFHLVPLNFSLIEEAKAFDPSLQWIETNPTQISAIANSREYLFVADRFSGASTSGMLCLLNESTSQFFRKVIARRLGMSSLSDYKRFPMLEIFESTTVKLYDLQLAEISTSVAES